MSEESNLRYEGLDSKHQSDIRYCFEMNLLEHGYAKHTVSECNDGRDEYIEETYVESDKYLSEAFDRRRDDKLTESN